MQVSIEQDILVSLVETRKVRNKQRQCRSSSQSKCNGFWQVWQKHQDYFYRLCLKWMNGNSLDAEDVLSQAMIKAWSKWSKHSQSITYPQAWLSRLIHNLCMDIHRQRQRVKIENIEDIEFANYTEFIYSSESVESNMFWRELNTYFRDRIESLPSRLRYPLILYYYQKKSHREIAQQLLLSEETVRKRVKQAQIRLRKQVKQYFVGEDPTYLDFPPLENLHHPTAKQKSHQKIQEQDPQNLEVQNLERAYTNFFNFDETPISQFAEINYKVTVICLETLPHWYNSPSFLG